MLLPRWHSKNTKCNRDKSEDTAGEEAESGHAERGAEYIHKHLGEVSAQWVAIKSIFYLDRGGK